MAEQKIVLGALLATFLAFLCPALDQDCAWEDSCRDNEPSHASLLQVDVNILKRYAQHYPRYFWSGKNADELRTGASEYTIDLNILKAGPAWSFLNGVHDVVRAAPLIDDKMNIYLATVRGNESDDAVGTVRKFSSDGKILWNYTDTSRISEVPSLYEGTIFFTNMQGIVTALDMETGKEIWRKSALVGTAKGGAPDTWSMTAGDGIVVSAVSSDKANNDYLVALDANTGEVKWNFQPDIFLYNFLAAVKDGSLLFSDVTGKLYRLNLQTGQLIWKVGPAKKGEEIQSGRSTGGTILGQNGVAYVTSNAMEAGKLNGFITAFNFSNGNFLWRESTIYEANNAAVFGNIGGRPAVAIGVGENPEFPNEQLQSKGVPDNADFLKEKKAKIIALDAVKGSLLWSHEVPAWHGWGAGDTMEQVCLPDSFGNAAISGDGTVFVGFQSGHLIGINDKDGNGQISPEEIAEFDTGRCVQGTPAIAPGMLAFTPCNGLHVFKTA